MGGVYLLGDREKDGVYKIGVTRGSIEKRIKSLQTGNSGEIYPICTFETEHPFLLETMLHNHYSSNNVKGEWFTIEDIEIFDFEKQCKLFENNIESLKDNCFFKKFL